MRKNIWRFAVTGALAMIMTASAAHGAESDPELTMEQIAEANTKENILNNSDSYLCKMSVYGGLVTKMYTSDELTIWSWKDANGEAQEIHIGGTTFGNYDGTCEAVLIADEDALEEQAVGDKSMMDFESTLKETIEEASLDGDQWKVTTVLSDEEFKAALEGFAYEYEEGDILINEYILDADTLLIQHVVETIKKADGTTEELGVLEISYGVEMPDEMKTLYQKMNEEPLRTVTIVLDPDTDGEKTYSATITQGIPVYLLCPENYSVYTDRACTESIDEQDSDLTQDATVYAIADAE